MENQNITLAESDIRDFLDAATVAATRVKPGTWPTLHARDAAVGLARLVTMAPADWRDCVAAHCGRFIFDVPPSAAIGTWESVRIFDHFDQQCVAMGVPVSTMNDAAWRVSDHYNPTRPSRRVRGAMDEATLTSWKEALRRILHTFEYAQATDRLPGETWVRKTVAWTLLLANVNALRDDVHPDGLLDMNTVTDLVLRPNSDHGKWSHLAALISARMGTSGVAEGYLGTPSEVGPPLYTGLSVVPRVDGDDCPIDWDFSRAPVRSTKGRHRK